MTSTLPEPLLDRGPIAEASRAQLATWLLVSFCWDLGRSTFIFLGPYYVNEATADPFLVGLTGAASWCFLPAGPLFGRISDALDRQRLMCGYMVFMACVAFLGNGPIPWWAMAVLMALLSLSNTLHMTTMTPYLGDLEPTGIVRMVALRTVLYNVCRILGPQLVGLAPERAALASALFFGAAGLAAATLPSVSSAHAKVAGSGSATVMSPAFVSVFGVTVLANLCYWSNQPIIPVLGKDLGVSAWDVGMLGSASFIGALPVSTLLALSAPERTGLIYCLGITLADLALAGASAPSYGAAFLSLVAAGAFSSLFGTVQSSMVMAMVPAAASGRAMGLLSLAIGAGPVGMLALGQLSAAMGAAPALRLVALIGVLAQGLWLCKRPEALQVRSG